MASLDPEPDPDTQAYLNPDQNQDPDQKHCLKLFIMTEIDSSGKCYITISLK